MTRVRYTILEKYKGLRVCIPGEVIDLLPDVPQAKLRKLYTMGYEGVAIDTAEKGEDNED